MDDDMENAANAEEQLKQQNQSGGAEKIAKPTLSEVRKSWGFRRTTIARREFMEEIADVVLNPPPLRRGRSRKASQTPQTTSDTNASVMASAPRTYIDDLEWSAPSSPVSEESKQVSEEPSGSSHDPTLWQDFGSAFHTAFSLLGGKEGLTMETSDILPASDVVEATNKADTALSKTIDLEVPAEMACIDGTNVLDTIAVKSVEGPELEDVVVISSREEDSDEMTLLQIKEQQASKAKQGTKKGKGGKGGRGRAKGRGRGRGRSRGKSRGRGRGRGKAVDFESSTADDDEEHEDDDDDDDDVIVYHQADQLRITDSGLHLSSAKASPRKSAEQFNSDCIVIESDVNQTADVSPGRHDQVPEEVADKQKGKNEDEAIEVYSSISDTEGYDAEALYCICRQKHNKRFMICCDSCQEWFHGDCVGISERQGSKMEKKGQDYICQCCTTKKLASIPVKQPESQPDPEISGAQNSPVCSLDVNVAGPKEPGANENAMMDKEPAVHSGHDCQMKMEKGGSLSQCIGPDCSKHALPDSVYCGTDCILQHAAATMKSLSGTKAPQTRGRLQRKVAAARLTALGREVIQVPAESPEEEGEDKQLQDSGDRAEATSLIACDPSLTDVQTTSIPSTNLNTASHVGDNPVGQDSKAAPPKTAPDDLPAAAPPPEADPSDLPICDKSPSPTTRDRSEEKLKKSTNVCGTKKQSDFSNPATAEKNSSSPAVQSSTSSAPIHQETGAVVVSKTSYVIPKKQSAPQPTTSKVPVSTSTQKQSSVLAVQNETRNLPVPPAPSAPSSRPSQPNHQVRQSIQRSLTSILFKRVCDCEDLELSENEVAKLVTSIESEMFDVFRNTDSKYMNKYRTIMFNMKDPRNKGLLYRFLRGEISPFRLVRMSQKDMQAVKAPEPSTEKPTEAKDTPAEATSILQKPEAVKVDLPSLNSSRSDRNMEQKRSLSQIRPIQPNQSLPDILTCMLKDTTSEHKTHLFDLKCKICTGQIPDGREEEPVRKRPKISESKDKNDLIPQSSWRHSAGDDSPLRAPPDSPDNDSPTFSLMESSSRLIIDSHPLIIAESPASPTTDSPASPNLESPASPVMDSPASPTSDTPKAKTGIAYTPVVIPAVSTVTITRRDPRTAASRFSALSCSSSGNRKTTQDQPASYAPFKEAGPTVPAGLASTVSQTLPKSILMKPTSSSDPRLYGASMRSAISDSQGAGETSQFLAKQDILWKGFLNMLNVAKFVTKAYLVSGSSENLKMDLPDTIQIGGRILPQTVWEYVAKLKTSVTKELCIIRFHPATEEEEVAYVSLFSYFSSRGRFGVVSNNSRSIKDVYLVPLSAKESMPSILQPLDGPGLEKSRPNILLGLAIIQKLKRPGLLPQELEEKRPKVQMSKDPMWIPKPPVLYGSDKLEIFQPYDPETPSSKTSPDSPSCPGSLSETSSSGSVALPSVSTSVKKNQPVSTSTTSAITECSSDISPASDKGPTATSSENTPLPNVLTSLFRNKQSDPVVPTEGNFSSMTRSAVKLPVSSQGSGSIVDPIVQQYGQKSKVKKIEEEEENEFDRPYDPEEEYHPAVGYGVVTPQSTEVIKADDSSTSLSVKEDVAYDPEDETIFEDFKSNCAHTKSSASTLKSDSAPSSVQQSTQVATTLLTSKPAQPSSPATVLSNLPTGTVVVSAATLTEQQRLLEELNKQIEEQKRQLKEQEEALRQQREAVGMFMAHFSVSDSLMSPPSKTIPVKQLSSLQSGPAQTDAKPVQSTPVTDKTSANIDNVPAGPEAVKMDETNSGIENNTESVTEPEVLENMNENDNYSSAGEIQDSDVAYDPEDESLFNEFQDDVFPEGSMRSRDSSLSRAGHNRKGSPHSRHSRKRRQSPKRRGHRERDRHRSPSKRSQGRSPSHSRRRKEKERYRRSESDGSRRRIRDPSEHRSRHRKGHNSHRHSHGRRKSPSSRTKNLASLSREEIDSSPHLLTENGSEGPDFLSNTTPDPATGPLLDGNTSSSSICFRIKTDPDDPELKPDIDCATPQQNSVDRDTSFNSNEHRHIVKIEKAEPPESAAPDEHLLSSKVSGNEQTDKTSQNDIMFSDKFEHTIPLRELEPPIRDSPQSPDPEPQFLKPSRGEENNLSEAEKIRDPESDTSAKQSPVNVEDQKHLYSHVFKGQCTATANEQSLDHTGNFESEVISASQLCSGTAATVPKLQFSDLGKSRPEISNQSLSGQGNNLQKLASDSSGFTGARNSKLHPMRMGAGFPDPQLLTDKLQTGFPQTNIRDPALSQMPDMNCPGSTMHSSGLNMGVLGIKFPNSKKDPGSMMVDSGTLPDNEQPKTQVMCAGQDISHESKDSSLRGPQIDVALSVDPSSMAYCDSGATDISQYAGKHTLAQVPKSRHVSEQSQHIRSQSLKGSHTEGNSTDLQHEDGVNTMHRVWHDVKNKIIDQQNKAILDRTKPPWVARGPNVPGLDMNCNVSGQRGQREDVRASVFRDHRQSGPELGVPAMHGVTSENRGFGGPSLMGPDTEARCEDPCVGPRGSEMRESGPERCMPHFEGAGPHRPGSQRPGRFGPGNPNFKGEAIEKRSPYAENPVYNQIGHRALNDRGPMPEMQGPNMRSSEYNNVGQVEFDSREPGTEWREPPLENTGQKWRGPSIQGTGPEWRDLDVEGPGHNMREESLRDYNGPGFERNIIDRPGLERRRPRGPDFRGPGPEDRGSNLQGPRPELIGPGGSYFRAPMFQSEDQLDRMDPVLSVPDHPGLRSLGHENEDPGTDSQRSNRRRWVGTDHMPFGPDKTSMGIEGPEPDRGMVQHFRGNSPERRYPGLESGEPHRGFSRGPSFRGGLKRDFRAPGPEIHDPNIEDPRPEWKGPEGYHFRGPEPERQRADDEPHGPIRRGPDFRQRAPEGRHPNFDRPGRGRRGTNLRRPGPERPVDLQDPGPQRGFPGGPHLQDFRSEMMCPDVPQGSDVRWQEIVPDRKDFTESVNEMHCPDVHIENPQHDRRGPPAMGFRGPTSERRGPRVENPGTGHRHTDPDMRDDPHTAHFREEPFNDWDGPHQESPDMRGPELNRKRPGPRGMRPMRRGMRRPFMGGRNREPGFRNLESDRRGVGIRPEGIEGSEDQWKNCGYEDRLSVDDNPHIEGQGHVRESYGNEWREPGPRGPGPIDERLAEPFAADRRGHEDEWRWPEGGGSRPMQDCPRDGEWTDPVCDGPRPNRRRPSPQFRREGDPCMRGPGHDRRGPHMTAPRSERREGPDITTDWRQEDINMAGCPSLGNPNADARDQCINRWRRPEMEGSCHDRGDPDFGDSFPYRRDTDMEGPGRRGPGPAQRALGPENRMPGIEATRGDRRSNSRGRSSERQGLYLENTEHTIQGYEQEFRRERRGSQMRKFGSEEKDPPLQDHWNRPDRRESEAENQRSETCGPNVGIWFDARRPEMREPGIERRQSEPTHNDVHESFIRDPRYECGDPHIRAMKGQVFRGERRGSEIRNFDMPTMDHFDNPSHQASRFQGPGGQQPPLLNRPGSSAPDSREPSVPAVDVPQHQQMLRPPRHRGALLPTPSQGPIRFPHHTTNVNAFGPKQKQKQSRQSTDSHAREWNRGPPFGVGKGVKDRGGTETEKTDSGEIKHSVVNLSDIKGKNDNKEESTTADSKVSS